MKYPKIALRGSPTTIKQLLTINPSADRNGFDGRAEKAYHYLDNVGNICASYRLPKGYKLISNISELKYNKLFKLL